MENKNSFILFTESWGGLSYLDDHQLASVIRALFSMHGASCPMPELDTMSQMALGFILPRIEENRKKYEAKVEQKRINGSKGGRPPKAKEPEAPLASPVSQENDTPSIKTEQNLEEPKKPTAFLGFQKNHDTGSDTDPDYVNTTYSDHTPLPPQGGTDAAASDVPMMGTDETRTDAPATEPVQVDLVPEQPSKRKRTDYRRKDFEEWKAEYGVKVDDDRLWKVWRKQILKIPDQAVLMAALARYKQSRQWQDGFIKKPDNYLRDCCWNDDFAPAQPVPRRGYGPDATGRTPYVREDEMDFSNVPLRPDGSVSWEELAH